jgi:hypothetical protein
MQMDTVGHSSCGRRPYKLISKTTLPKEIVFVQNAKNCLLPSFRFNGELHFPLLDKKQSARTIALGEDYGLLFEGQPMPALSNG